MTTIKLLQFYAIKANSFTNLKYLQTGLTRLLVVSLLYAAIIASPAWAMAPTPRITATGYSGEPSPEWPEGTALSLTVTDTLNMSWPHARFAEYYIILRPQEGEKHPDRWMHDYLFQVKREDEIARVYGSGYVYQIDYRHQDWQLHDMALVVAACNTLSRYESEWDWWSWSWQQYYLEYEQCTSSDRVSVRDAMPIAFTAPETDEPATDEPTNDERIPQAEGYTIQWAVNSDSLNYYYRGAKVSLYYDTDDSGYDGTLITDNLESTQTSYHWDTSSLPIGNYYLYAKLDNGIALPFYIYSPRGITLNQQPSIALTAPETDEVVDTSYTISWTASDPDDQASISLYYDTNNSGNDGTLITNSLSEGIHTSYTWNTSSLSSGDYYIYAKINDGVNLPVYDYGAGRITVNRPPSITITAPAANTTVDASFTISWSASDPDNQANISLYYDTNNSGYDGTLITNSLSEGIHSSYLWNTSSLASREYYIYAKIDDGVNVPVYNYGAGRITVNRAPSITLTAPASDMIASAHHKITWVANDADNQASISLYYDTNSSGYDGTLITDSLSEGIHTSYTWDTSALSSGDYHIYAKIDDGVNPPVYRYANGKVTVVPVKLNDAGITWGGDYPSGNNSTCTGENEQGEAIIAQQDCSHGRDAQAAAGTLTKVGGGAASFDFTRLNADGSDYTGSGDYANQPWACVRDNYTGLIWEVKTDDGGIHDKDNTYRWGGKTALVTQQARDDGWGDFYDDWDTLVDGSNDASLCGFSDWRVPTLMELDSIVDADRINPSTDSNYFPNTRSSRYWSSSPRAYGSSSAWIVYFYDGYGYYSNRSSNNYVRLVRGGQ